MLAPPGEARDLARQAGVAFEATPDEVDDIAEILSDLFEQHISGGIRVQPNEEFIQQLALPEQQFKFVEAICSVLGAT